MCEKKFIFFLSYIFLFDLITSYNSLTESSNPYVSKVCGRIIRDFKAIIRLFKEITRLFKEITRLFKEITRLFKEFYDFFHVINTIIRLVSYIL